MQIRSKLLFLNLLLFILNFYLLYQAKKIQTKFEENASNDGYFYFDISEASYLDGKPFYRGKHGGVHLSPNVELGGKVWKMKKEMGTITEVSWDQTRGRLEIGFCPINDIEIFVGEEVCVKTN